MKVRVAVLKVDSYCTFRYRQVKFTPERLTAQSVPEDTLFQTFRSYGVK